MPNANTLTWDQTGEREYESGVSKGVLFPQNADGTYASGVAWNGLRSVGENPDGAEPQELWADNMKYAVLYSAENYKGSIGAYTYPDEFDPCLGNASPATGVTIGQQKHQPFGLCYRTEIGSDATTEKGYILHFIYGAVAQPADIDYETQDDNPDAVEFEWDYDCTPVAVTGYKPTAHVKVNSTKVTSAKMTALEAIVYGDGTSSARLPLPSEIFTTVT